MANLSAMLVNCIGLSRCARDASIAQRPEKSKAPEAEEAAKNARGSDDKPAEEADAPAEEDAAADSDSRSHKIVPRDSFQHKGLNHGKECRFTYSRIRLAKSTAKST